MFYARVISPAERNKFQETNLSLRFEPPCLYLLEKIVIVDSMRWWPVLINTELSRQKGGRVLFGVLRREKRIDKFD